MSHKKSIKLSFLQHAPESASDIVQSQWQTGDKCFRFLLWRWVVVILFISIVFTSIATSTIEGTIGFYLIFFSNWGILFGLANALLGAYLVTVWHYSDTRGKNSSESQLKRVRDKIYWNASTVTIVQSSVTTFMFWTLIYDGRTLKLNTISKHGLNAVVMLLDLLIVKHKVKMGQALYTAAFAIAFVIFSNIYDTLGGRDEHGHNYIYVVLNWSEKPLPALFFSSLTILAVLVVHTLVFLVQKARSKIYRYCCKTTDFEIVPTNVEV